ncbi:tRNA modification GTPase, TrmE family [Skeletonema marinoi]|uniref:tRNA modification GTPase, TrmE family n=1 Tax=Skeletonema marinoi TaxID=267567 RepID=A0AAD8Y5K1_9STRA|nr:tRNA modification GTPase, TrmE family [Skeletonema marinoi]
MLHQNHIHLSRRVGPQIHHSLLTSQQQQQYAQNHLKFPHVTIHKSTAQSGEDTITKNDDTEYQTTSEEETIFALSSGGGGASVGGGATAVAVIRMSGPCAFNALRELLSPSPNGLSGGGKLPKLPKARMASLRTLYDPLTNNDSERRDPLDSALILTFPGPNSFTGEDIVELHCHGSRAVVNGVLSALTHLNSVPIPAISDEESQQARRRRLSLRPADPGEFTQRAYAHGKLGLVEVEALSDLIVADTSLQRKQALKQFDGRLSRLYMGWREELIKGLAHAEAVIDFGDDEALDPDEEDDGDMDGDGGMSIWGGISPRITSLRQAMERHLADASRGELLRDGLRIAIVGRPNAGKSSLLNLLAGRDAAIVSSTPGTTRDVVEVILDLGGVRCTLLDTAGVREEKEEGVNEIEVEGMKRARIAAKDAHIVVGVVDSTDYERGLEAVDELINGDGDFDDWKKDNILYVVNKVDLKNEMKDNDCLSKSNSFGISCTTSEGVNDFLSVLTTEALSLVSSDNDEASSAALSSLEGSEGAVITRARHRRHVEAAADALGRFEVLSGQGYMALDMAAEELRLAASELGRITGAIDVEDVLDVLFADFCIGK